MYLWKQRLFGKQSASGYKRRYHLNKQAYFWDIYPDEIKILIWIYMYKVVSCSTQFYLQKRRSIGVEQNKCYQREVVEKLWNNHTMENYVDTKNNALELFSWFRGISNVLLSEKRKM